MGSAWAHCVAKKNNLLFTFLNTSRLLCIEFSLWLEVVDGEETSKPTTSSSPASPGCTWSYVKENWL